LNSYIKKRLEGYLDTAMLSPNKSLFGLEPYPLEYKESYAFSDTEFKIERLGKLVEQFVYFQLRENPKVELLATNLQIKDNTRTIGELDALLIKENKPIHLEIVYKFYLYDTLQNYENPLNYWIGPNRNDTLRYKLDKLKNKQFPLLYNAFTMPYLRKYNFKQNEISQHICFKAQLFLPYYLQNIDIWPLNKNCISGFHISFTNIAIFTTFKFFLPEKLDWLISPHNNIKWLNFEDTIVLLQHAIDRRKSPLVWLKDNNDSIKKCFVTWW